MRDSRECIHETITFMT
ncbi:hypothetical protein F383_21768 [Gossypium arboreum]|uniref:Uncharacterized protein n=1 Tax=Gossypium arboreum TaxID=29729 RepID=A0A0B0NZ74_GOSAR|nr:hypothetical protein F383_21768 [Gossypium arboreum]